MREKLERAIRDVLECLGEYRAETEDTPRRVAGWLLHFCNRSSLEEELSAIFPEKSDCRQLVMVRDVPFYALCEHHILPYFGTATIAYIPNGHIVGLSKVVKLVHAACRGLTLQERVADLIADALWRVVSPRGVAVRLEAEHMCISMRKAHSKGSKAVALSIRGDFPDEYLALMERR